MARGARQERGKMNHKIAYLGIFTSAAMILAYVETLLPVFAGVPGVKLGLANLAVLLTLYQSGWHEAALVSFVRILAIGFLFGNLFSIAYSASGGALSLLCMLLLKKTGKFSVTGVSVAGGVSHNLGQLFMAMAVVENFSLAYYLPVLLVSGTVTGFCIGILGNEMLRRIPFLKIE